MSRIEKKLRLPVHATPTRLRLRRVPHVPA